MTKIWGEKFDRIRFLMTQDLNTPVTFLVQSPEEVVDAILAIKSDKASIRTYSTGFETRSKTPFHPNIPKAEAQEKALELLKNRDYAVMVCEGVPIEDTEISAISIVQADDIYTEYAEGPGTVRRLSMGQVTPKRITYNKFSDIALDPRIEKVMIILSRLHCMDIMFEWSWCNHPVGLKRQNCMFWEWMNEGPSAYFEGWNQR